MGREIKFRAWNTIVHRMQEFTLPYLESLNGNKIQWHILEIMQYTGLKDKNGKEIYEGDIYHMKVGNYEIIFNNGCFCVNRIGRNAPVPINWMPENCEDCMVDNFASKIEIIGNIYQNPELL